MSMTALLAPYAHITMPARFPLRRPAASAAGLARMHDVPQLTVVDS